MKEEKLLELEETLGKKQMVFKSTHLLNFYDQGIRLMTEKSLEEEDTIFLEIISSIIVTVRMDVNQ